MLEKGVLTQELLTHAHLIICGRLVSCHKVGHIIIVQTHCHLNAPGNLKDGNTIVLMLTGLAGTQKIAR